MKGRKMKVSFKKNTKIIVIGLVLVAIIGSITACSVTSKTWKNGDRSIKVTASTAKLTKFYFEGFDVSGSGAYSQSGTSVSITMDNLSLWHGSTFAGTIKSDGSSITAYGYTYTAV